MHLILFFSLLSYLLGSFSSAFWFSKWLGNIDIREFGSKNAGATNVYRALGFKIAICVFIVDIMKSFVAVQFVNIIPDIICSSESYVQIKILFGLCAVIGHVFPIYSGFRGGRGVASLFGLFLGLDLLTGCVTILFYIIILLITRIASIASISTGFFYLLVQLFALCNSSNSTTKFIFSIFCCFFILFTHKANIKRLKNGNEKKMF